MSNGNPKTPIPSRLKKDQIKTPLPSALKKKDRSGVSPSPSVSGDSSLGLSRSELYNTFQQKREEAESLYKRIEAFKENNTLPALEESQEYIDYLNKKTQLDKLKPTLEEVNSSLEKYNKYFNEDQQSYIFPNEQLMADAQQDFNAAQNLYEQEKALVNDVNALAGEVENKRKEYGYDQYNSLVDQYNKAWSEAQELSSKFPKFEGKPLGATSEYDKRKEQFIEKERQAFYEKALSKLPSEQPTFGDYVSATWNSVLEGMSGFSYNLLKSSGLGDERDLASWLEENKNSYPEFYQSYQKNKESKAAFPAMVAFFGLPPNKMSDIGDRVETYQKEREKEAWRETFGLPIDPKKEEKIKETFLGGALTGLGASTPAMVASAPTMGMSFFDMAYQGADENLKQIKWEKGVEMSPLDEETYKLTIGATNLILERVGLRNVLKGTPMSKSLANYFSSKAYNRLAKEAAESGGKVSKESFDRVVNEEASAFLKYAKGVANGTISEFETGTLQSLAEDFTEQGINIIQGREIFDTKTVAEIASDAIYSGAQEAVGGGIMSSTIGIFATDNPSKKDKVRFMKLIESTDDVEGLKKELKLQIAKNRIDKDQSQRLLDKIDEYSQIIESLPEDLTTEAKVEAVELLQKKKKLETKLAKLDDAFKEPVKKQIEEINNSLRNLEGKTTQVTKTEEDAVQKRETEEVPVGEQAQVGEEMVGEVREQAEEVRSEEEVRQREDAVISAIDSNEALNKIDNKEPLNIEEANKAQEELLALIDDLDPARDAELIELIEDEFQRIEDYDNKTETVTETTTERRPVGPPKRVAKIKERKASETVGGLLENSQIETGSEIEGEVSVLELDDDGNIVISRYSTSKRKEDVDRLETGKKPDEVDFVETILDDSGNVIGVRLRIENPKGQPDSPIEFNVVKRNEEDERPLDIAIASRLKEVGDVAEVEFEQAYETVTKTKTKEVPITKKGKGVNIEQEVKDLEKLFSSRDPQFQLETKKTDINRKQKLLENATKLMDEIQPELVEQSDVVEVPDMETIPINVTENKELAAKVPKMKVADLAGKKINLVMADQLKVDDNFMGGPFFPLQDDMFGKVAWASIDKRAARQIVRGAMKSDNSVVYNMSPTAVDSNTAVITEFIKDVKKAENSEVIFNEMMDYLKNKKYDKNTEKVRGIAEKAKSLDEFIELFSELNVDTKSAIIKDMLPSSEIKSATKVGILLQELGITQEGIRSEISEQFAKDLPMGAMTMVLKITDAEGNPITTGEDIDKAIITPEQQKEEGLREHPNYPFYIRGKAVAMLEDTVPFWNVSKKALSTINAKIAGITQKDYSSAQARGAEMRRASMKAASTFEATQPTETQYQQFVNKLSKAFPNVEVATSQEEFNNLLKDLNTKSLATKNQKVYGAVYGGKLYLNPSLENYNTPIHEFGHVWMNTAKELAPELYLKGIELIEQSPEYVTQIQENADYQRVIKKMRKDGATDEFINEYILEEALATAIGDKGESFAKAAQKKNFKNWINELFEFIKKLPGISKLSLEEIQNLSLEDFLNGVVVDLLSENEVFQNAEARKLGNQLQLMAGRFPSIADVVRIGRKKGFSDEGIRAYLNKMGYPANEIKEALSNLPTTKKAPSVKKILGKTPSKTEKKVTMTDKAVVKQRIQDMVKAANEGYRAGKREVKGFAEEIDKVLKDIPKEIGFTSQQTTRIAKAAKGVTTPSQLNNFLKTAEKVIDDAQYAAKLKTAEDNQTFIQKRGKSKNYPSNITKLFRDFAKIDPARVDDIDQYNFYAEEVRRIISKPKIVEGQVQETPQISIQEIRDEYIDKYNTLSQDDLRNSLMEDYDFLPDDVKDMSPEEIQEIVDAIYSEEDVAEEPGENKNKGLEKLIDYKLIEIADIPTDNLTDAEKQQIEIITGADIQSLELSRKELGELYLYLQNYILNGQLNNISSVTAKIEARDAINNYLKEGVTPKEWITKIRGFAFGTMNMTQLYEAVGGSQDTGAKIYEVTNTYEYAEKKTEAENIFSGKIRDYAKKFKNSKVVENTKDRADRQIYGFLAQVPRDKYQQALEFIDNSIQYHEEGFAGFESKATGEEIRKLFDEKYKGTASIDQVKMSKSNMDIIDWMRNLFKEIKPEYFENAEIVHNRTLEEPVEEGKYLPFTSRKKGKIKFQEDSIDNPSSLLDKVIIPNRSGATNKRENVFNPTDRYMTFDFERSMFSAYENQLLDIKTSYTIKKIAAFFRDPKSIDVFGGNELDMAFFNRTKEYVNNSFNSDSLGDLENSLFRVLNTLSNWSGRVALGGVDQAVKQSIPVLLNTSVNVGMTETFDALMDYNNPMARNTFKNSPVSRRSFVDQDTRKIYSNIPEADRKSAIGRIMKAFSVGDAKAEQIMMYAIQHSDKYAAQVSWLAYYKKKRGADFKGWDVEGKSPNKSASAFADLMISNTQNVNDIEQQASWLKVNQSESAGRWFSLVRRSSLPFISFKVNQIMDEVVQISKLKAKPKEAVRRLGGRLGEQMAYVAFRKGIYALYGGAAVGLLSLLGIEPEDEEEKTEEEKTREWAAIAAEGVLGTTPFYGLSGYVDRKVGTGLNRYYYYNIMDDKTRDKYAGFGGRLSTRGMTEKDIEKKYERGFESFMKDKPPVFVRMKDSDDDFGMLSIGLDNHASDAKELYQSFLSLSTGEDYEYETMRGDYIQLPLTEEEKKALIWLSILENTDYALPNDIAKIAGRSKRKIFTEEFNEMFDTGR